jgi:hypothetical protein
MRRAAQLLQLRVLAFGLLQAGMSVSASNNKSPNLHPVFLRTEHLGEGRGELCDEPVRGRDPNYGIAARRPS